MHRPVSPLLHDYKPSAASRRKDSRALQWFAVGLGIPLLGLALLSGLSTSTNSAVSVKAPIMTATDAAEPDSDKSDDDLILVSASLIAMDPEPVSEYDTLTLTIRSGDTLDKLFRKNNLDLGHLSVIARLEEARERLPKINPGDVFEIVHDDGKLISMYTTLGLTSALRVDRNESGFTAKIVERPIEIRKRFAYGVIDNSLFESAATAGLSDKVIMNIAGIFAWDIDFVLDIRTGDSFYVQYEEIWQDGEFVTDSEIIVAEFNNDGRTNRAIRFIDDANNSDYFTPDGHSVRKAFIRAPVDFTRISSNFNPNRRHPILNKIRAHRGVDYAAPRGTPIKAAGDGRIIHRGVKNGYGNAVILQHGGNITTLYAHMSRFASKARMGARIKQGQIIGYVGATGLATANHLHYEYRINGVHRNPRTVDLPRANPIESKYREQFLAEAEPVLHELEQFKRAHVASVAYSSE